MIAGAFAGGGKGGRAAGGDDDDAPDEPDGMVGGSDGSTPPVFESGLDTSSAEEGSSPKPKSEGSARAEE